MFSNIEIVTCYPSLMSQGHIYNWGENSRRQALETQRMPSFLSADVSAEWFCTFLSIDFYSTFIQRNLGFSMNKRHREKNSSPSSIFPPFVSHIYYIRKIWNEENQELLDHALSFLWRYFHYCIVLDNHRFLNCSLTPNDNSDLPAKWQHHGQTIVFHSVGIGLVLFLWNHDKMKSWRQCLQSMFPLKTQSTYSTALLKSVD